MDIERCAANRKGAEPKVVVSNVTPQLVRESGRLLLRTAHNPSPNDDGTEYDYTVSLTDADLALIVALLAAER